MANFYPFYMYVLFDSGLRALIIIWALQVLGKRVWALGNMTEFCPTYVTRDKFPDLLEAPYAHLQFRVQFFYRMAVKHK